MREKKTTTTHTTPGLLFKKSMTTDLLQDQIIILQSVLGPAPEWRGVPQSFGTSGGPEAKKGRWKILDPSATLVNSWPPDCNVFLSFSRVPIWSFVAWRAKSQLPMGIFLGIKIPISRPMFEGPSAHNPYLKQAISATAEFGRFGRRRELPFRPYLHARIPRITVVEQLPQILK